jgi:hypothetical protein
MLQSCLHSIKISQLLTIFVTLLITLIYLVINLQATQKFKDTYKTYKMDSNVFKLMFTMMEEHQLSLTLLAISLFVNQLNLKMLFNRLDSFVKITQDFIQSYCQFKIMLKHKIDTKW